MKKSLPIVDAVLVAGEAARRTAEDTSGRRPAWSGPVALLRRVGRNRLNVASGFVLLMMAAVALLAPVIAPYGRDAVNTTEIWQPPGRAHWFGTDQFGRDVLTRVLHGARISLFVGVLAVLLAMAAGIPLGALGGYLGGLLDELIMRVVDMLMSMPYIILALALVSILGPSLTHLIPVLAIFRVAQFARVTRGSTLALRGLEFVEACRAQGQGPARIIIRHVLPNCLAPLVVLATVSVGNVILAEAALSFLGLGIQAPIPSWGGMISEGKEYLIFAWWLSTFPGLFLMMTLLAFNLLGDGLRDALDPRLKDQP
jgi:peptide/nickel transport system permease protein